MNEAAIALAYLAGLPIAEPVDTNRRYYGFSMMSREEKARRKKLRKISERSKRRNRRSH